MKRMKIQKSRSKKMFKGTANPRAKQPTSAKNMRGGRRA